MTSANNDKKIDRIPFPVLEILREICNCVGEFSWKCELQLSFTVQCLWDAFQFGIICFKVKLRNLNPRKITFLDSFFVKQFSTRPVWIL